MIILVCAFSGGVTALHDSIEEGMIVNILLISSIIGIALYIFSWYLSIVFLEKREF